MPSVTAILLLFVSSVATACPLCGDSQGYRSPEELISRQRASAVYGGNASPPPNVIDVVREEVPTSDMRHRLDRVAAASAVLASPVDGGARFKVVEVIRGETPAGALIEPSWIVGLDHAATASAKPLLLIRGQKWQSWANVGSIGVEHAPWLRRLSASKPTTAMTDAEWETDADLVLPYLENAEPLAAEIAYGELARAPYLTLRSLKGLLDIRSLRRWTADPMLTKRQSLYTLLLGVEGDATDAARMEQQLTTAWRAKNAINLGPMLAASLELGGPFRMAWIDAQYMRDPDRTNQELQAVLLALSVQGGANARIPRERVIESYRTFIGVHKSLAGFVAQDLATWNYWDAGPEYVALLRSDFAQHPASRYAMLTYLKQSPRPKAKAAVAALATAVK